MNKFVLLLLLVAVAGVTWALLGENNTSSGWDPNAAEDFSRTGEGDPTLLGAEGAGPRPKAVDAPRKTRSQRAAERLAAETRVYLKGLVLAQEGGTRIAGAKLWTEPAQAPCPRIPKRSPLQALLEQPQAGRNPAGIVFGDPTGAVTDKSGRFEWRVPIAELPQSNHLDVFVQAKGYVMGVLCRPGVGDDVTIRLQRALQIPIRVTDRHQRPLEGARVTLRPAEGTDAIPGHAGLAITDREGRCEIDGLLPGEVMITADHPDYMPGSFGPLDPSKIDSFDFELAPAFRLRFEIRSDDGSAIVNPVLTWKTDGTPPASDLLLLQVTASGPDAEPRTEVKSEPVRIPCVDRNVQLELKADGFQPWRPEPEPIPQDGGTRAIIASLTRDTSLAPLTVKFEDAEGKPVPYRELKASLDPPQALDGQAVGAITLEAGETLEFPSLPAGRYRFGVRCARYAPAIFDVLLVAGEKNEHVVRLTEPARMRIRFTAPERLMVRFRVVSGGQQVRAFPLKANGDPAQGGAALRAAGNEGALFGGLPGGTVTIEVTDDTLTAAPTSVSLRPGDTTDVEIEVRRK